MYPVFSWPVTIITLSILVLASFFLSLSETAIISLSRIRLRHMISRGVRGAHSVQRLINKLDKFISAILVFNNFVNIAISAIITGVCILTFGYKWGVVIATFSALFFIVIICEITPKILAIKHTERVAVLVAPMMEALIKLFNPVISFFSAAGTMIIRLMRIKPTKRSPLINEEELRLMIEIGKEEGFLSEEKVRMLQKIFEFGNICVKDVMIPKDKIISVDVKTTSEELLNIFVEEGHARLPVYKENPANIIGIIYANDLLYILRDRGLFLLQDLVHEAYYVPSKMPVTELLKKFQEDKLQIAIVVDERNKAVGLVTLEDLIEEIVGEIEEKQSHNKHAREKEKNKA